MNNMATGKIGTVPKDPGFISLPPTGIEGPLTEMQTQVIDTVRRFARDVMRPIGMQLDRKTPEQVVAKDSPLWTVYAKFRELGLTVSSILELPEEEKKVLIPAVWEELGYGDGGLAISIAVSMLPHLYTAEWGRMDLFNRIPETNVGCWGITEPDHGSDVIDIDNRASYPGGRRTKPNLLATIKGDKIILNGQKSAWVTNGTIAHHSLLFTACDRGNGPDENIVLLCPLDSKGVTKGKPLDKIGQRPLNQGEIFFDNVEVPLDNLIVHPEQYKDAIHAILAEVNVVMACVFTGVAPPTSTPASTSMCASRAAPQFASTRASSPACSTSSGRWRSPAPWRAVPTCTTSRRPRRPCRVRLRPRSPAPRRRSRSLPPRSSCTAATA